MPAVAASHYKLSQFQAPQLYSESRHPQHDTALIHCVGEKYQASCFRELGVCGLTSWLAGTQLGGTEEPHQAVSCLKSNDYVQEDKAHIK